MSRFRTLVATLLVASLALMGPQAYAAPRPEVELGTPHVQAHAHNDYEHANPLYDALAHGFTSVEADVWLVDGELLVAHDLEDVQPGRTLESLYLQPLAGLARGRGGSIYPSWNGEFQLLIDIKSDGEATWSAIEEALAEYRQIFTRYHKGKVKRGPVLGHQ